MSCVRLYCLAAYVCSPYHRNASKQGSKYQVFVQDGLLRFRGDGAGLSKVAKYRINNSNDRYPGTNSNISGPVERVVREDSSSNSCKEANKKHRTLDVREVAVMVSQELGFHFIACVVGQPCGLAA